MSFSWTRVGAILRKELRDYRRNRFNVIAPSLGLALAVAAGLLVVDALGRRLVATTFDRERLIAGNRS